MKLEFERDAVPSRLLEELDFSGFLNLFDLDIPLLPHVILHPMKEDEGKRHFKRLCELEARIDKANADLREIVAQSGKPPSLDLLLPFFRSGGLEQFHLYDLGRFVLEDRKLKQLENGFHFNPEANVCETIQGVLERFLKKGFSGFRYSPDEEKLRVGIESAEEELKSKLSEYEKDIYEQTGLKMIYPYPREIPPDSELLPRLKKCPLVSVTPGPDRYTVGYKPAGRIEKTVRKKDDLSEKLGLRMEGKLKQLGRELQPYFEQFETYYRQRKKRTYDYALVWVKKSHSLCFPEFRAETGCELKKAVLPCLRESRGEEYIPLTVSLERGANVLFGANMTGKTTVLKTVYFHLTAVRMGLPIPAESAVLRFPELVEIHLKSSGNIRSNLSGFGEELRFFSNPLFSKKRLEDSAYILSDELFQSTDPLSGAELSEIFLKEFSYRELVFLCTSHYRETLFVPSVSLFKMKNAKFPDDDTVDLAKLMENIPYDLERIEPDEIEEALGQGGNPLRIALHFPLPDSVREKIRSRLSRKCTGN